MSKEELLFCPLGGSGEIGGNMNLYAYGKEDNQKWIIVDMGVSFADDWVQTVMQLSHEKTRRRVSQKKHCHVNLYAQNAIPRRPFWR